MPAVLRKFCEMTKNDRHFCRYTQKAYMNLQKPQLDSVCGYDNIDRIDGAHMPDNPWPAFDRRIIIVIIYEQNACRRVHCRLKYQGEL